MRGKLLVESAASLGLNWAGRAGMGWLRTLALLTCLGSEWAWDVWKGERGGEAVVRLSS